MKARAPEQLELRDASESVDSAWWRLWREALAEEISRITLKEVAAQLDEKPSDINNGLAERDRHYFHARWMVWLIGRSPKLAALAARQNGLVVERAKKMSPEEENARLKRAIAKAGPAAQAYVEAEVYGDDTSPFEKLK